MDEVIFEEIEWRYIREREKKLPALFVLLGVYSLILYYCSKILQRVLYVVYRYIAGSRYLP
jgi:hypothetical protein